MKTPPVILTLPARAEYLPMVSSAARQSALARGFARDEAERIGLAMIEAATSAVEMSFRTSEDTIEITIAHTSKGISLQVRSHGLPLEACLLPTYDPDRAENEQDVTGLGLLLMNSLMDKVSHSILTGDRRELVLVKHLPANMASSDHSRDGKAALPPRQDGPLTLRRAVPEDADSIARLAMRSHDEVLFSEHIYYPQRVADMINSGEMVSMVATTEAGELVGHGAQLKGSEDARVAELTFGFVDLRYRGCGAIKSISAGLMDLAAQSGLTALRAFAVTNHVGSQRAIIGEGFHECGLLLATTAAARAWGVDKTEVARIGNLMFQLQLVEEGEQALHLPPRHSAMILSILDGLGVRTVPAGEPCRPSAPRASLVTHVERIEGWGTISVLVHGTDLTERAVSLARGMRRDGIPVVQLLMPLSDPATPAAGEDLERSGFFFCGVGQGDTGQWQLVLQILQGVDPGYDSVHVHSEFGREILNYVRSCDPTASP